MHKTINKDKKSVENFCPQRQTYTPGVIYKPKPKSGPPYSRQMVHPRPQTQQG